MSLSDLANLGEFVSSIAVLASLIYLGIQVRDAKRNQRAVVQQGRAARLVDMMLRLSEDATADILGKSLRDDGFATDEELGRFRSIFMALTYSMEDTFLHHRSQLIDEEEFQSFRTRMSAQFMPIAMRTMWRQTRTWHGPEFRHFIDGIIRDARLTPAADPITQWREAVAAERNAPALALQSRG